MPASGEKQRQGKKSVIPIEVSILIRWVPHPSANSVLGWDSTATEN